MLPAALLMARCQLAPVNPNRRLSATRRALHFPLIAFTLSSHPHGSDSSPWRPRGYIAMLTGEARAQTGGWAGTDSETDATSTPQLIRVQRLTQPSTTVSAKPAPKLLVHLLFGPVPRSTLTQCPRAL